VVIRLPPEKGLPRIHQPLIVGHAWSGNLEYVLAQGYISTETFSPSVPIPILVCKLVDYCSYPIPVSLFFLRSLRHPFVASLLSISSPFMAQLLPILRNFVRGPLRASVSAGRFSGL
jgi:hypothetical protein